MYRHVILLSNDINHPQKNSGCEDKHHFHKNYLGKKTPCWMPLKVQSQFVCDFIGLLCWKFQQG